MMKKTISYKLILWWMLGMSMLPLFGQSKYGGELFNLFQDPRGHALGGSLVADTNGVYSGLWNPAGIASLRHIQIGVVHTNLFLSDISYNVIGAGFRYSRYNVGLLMVRMGIDDIKDSRFALVNDEIQFENVTRFSVADYLFLLSVSPRDRGGKFNYGMSVKYLYKAYHVETASGMGIDVGAMYHINSYLTVGVNLKNALGTVVLWSTGKKEWIRPEMAYGVTAVLPYKKHFKMKGYLNFFNYLDNRQSSSLVHVSSLSQDISLGGALQFKKRVQLYAGLNQTRQFTYGAAITIPRITLTYAQLKHKELGYIHNVGVEFELPY